MSSPLDPTIRPLRSNTRPRRAACTLAVALSLAACGEVVMNHEDPDGPDAGGSRAPTVTITPAEGARGVRLTDRIVLTFSQPMDTASVLDAWSSTSLPAEELSFSWNEDNTVLSVDASKVLEYPVGDQEVDVFSYDFTIGTTATGADGTPLESAVSRSFHTARDVTMKLFPVPAGTGSFDSNGVGTDIRIGDNAANYAWRGFISIDLSSVPGVVELVSASLFARQIRVVGSPYLDLGRIQLVSLAPIAAIDDAAYVAAPRADLGMFSNSSAVDDPGGNRNIDVTAQIAADLDEGASTSSFRLQFESAHDAQGDDDHATFDPFSVQLEVRLLAE